MVGADVLMLGGYREDEANDGGAEVVGISGLEARVVPDHNERTGEFGEVKFGKGSH